MYKYKARLQMYKIHIMTMFSFGAFYWYVRMNTIGERWAPVFRGKIGDNTEIVLSSDHAWFKCEPHNNAKNSHVQDKNVSAFVHLSSPNIFDFKTLSLALTKLHFKKDCNIRSNI